VTTGAADRRASVRRHNSCSFSSLAGVVTGCVLWHVLRTLIVLYTDVWLLLLKTESALFRL